MVNTASPKPSAVGLASVAGLAILAHPRGISARTIVVDAQLYLGPTDKDLLVGSLRYFNLANVTFEDEPNLYFVVTTVSILLPVTITMY